MKDKIPVALLALFIGVILLLIYVTANDLNPNSRFCHYQIYRQPDGTYEVWWVLRTRHIEQGGLTYEQAKVLQEEKCKSLKAFIDNRPKGQRVK